MQQEAYQHIHRGTACLNVRDAKRSKDSDAQCGPVLLLTKSLISHSKT